MPLRGRGLIRIAPGLVALQPVSNDLHGLHVACMSVDVACGWMTARSGLDAVGSDLTASSRIVLVLVWCLGSRAGCRDARAVLTSGIDACPVVVVLVVAGYAPAVVDGRASFAVARFKLLLFDGLVVDRFSDRNNYNGGGGSQWWRWARLTKHAST